jgi:hypothetical protein
MEPHRLWLRSGDNRHSLRHEIGRPRMTDIVGKPALAGFSRALLVVFIGSGLAACVIGAAIYDAGRLFLPQ